MISVIVPVYNCERYLAQAINSVLQQTLPASEIIIVDDGSTDRTAEIANRFTNGSASIVRYEWQPNSGAAAARNHGVGLAEGNILAFLDADDLWTANKLSLQAKALDESRDNEAVFGMLEQFVSPELDETEKAIIHCPDKALPGYTHCTMLIRRDAFLRVGLFETDWNVGEFVAWYLRALEKKLASVMLPEVVLRRRLHADNQGRHKRDFQTDYVRILKASLDRRRQKI